MTAERDGVTAIVSFPFPETARKMDDGAVVGSVGLHPFHTHTTRTHLHAPCDNSRTHRP